jgi:hypothetical protein
MANTSKFDYEAVAEACETLEKTGKLTLEEVRRFLGGGSYSTLLIHYREWKKYQQTQTLTPPQIDETTTQMWYRLCHAIQNQAKEYTKYEQESLQQQIQELEDALAQGEEKYESLYQHQQKCTQEYQQALTENQQQHEKTLKQHQHAWKKKYQNLKKHAKLAIQRKKKWIAHLEHHNKQQALRYTELEKESKERLHILEEQKIRTALAEQARIQEQQLYQEWRQQTEQKEQAQQQQKQIDLENQQKRLESLIAQELKLKEEAFIWKQRALSAEAARQALAARLHASQKGHRPLSTSSV